MCSKPGFVLSASCHATDPTRSYGADMHATSDRTDLPVVHLGRTITTEDVRLLEDDEE